MSTQSIFHLEHFPEFRRRVTDLNRMYVPDDPLHDALHLEGPEWERLLKSGSEDPGSLAHRALEARRALQATHAHFPAGEPVHEQAAYIVRAFTGLRPFPEANFRTGWDYLGELLIHDGHELLATETDGRALANDLWERVQGWHPEELRDGRLAEQDDVHRYLAEWFRSRIG